MHTGMTTHQRLGLAARRLREVNAEFSATLAQARKDLAAAKAELEREKKQDRVEEQFAERARSGKAGRELRRIQELVDRGQVTWDDVILGRAEEWMTIAFRRSMAKFTAALDREALAATEPGRPAADDDGVFDDPLATDRRR